MCVLGQNNGDASVVSTNQTIALRVHHDHTEYVYDALCLSDIEGTTWLDPFEFSFWFVGRN